MGYYGCSYGGIDPKDFYILYASGEFLPNYSQSYQVFNKSLDEPVIIGNKVLECSNMFYQCRIFNSSVTMGARVKSTDYMFYGCTNFNQPLTLPKTIKNCHSMFTGSFFNSIVTIEEGANSLEGLFFGARNFNQNIIIPNTVKNCALLFSGANIFNQNIIIPNSIENYYQMFNSCVNFNPSNYHLSFSNNAINCAYMFNGCLNFNPETIDPFPDSIEDCRGMFQYCLNFNYPLVFGRNLKDASMLLNTYSENTFFNSILDFSNCVYPVNMYSFIQNMNNFNALIIFPEEVSNISEALKNCTNFNQPLVFPKESDNFNYYFGYTNILDNCISFNSDVTIPDDSGFGGVFSTLMSLNQWENSFQGSITIGNNVCDKGNTSGAAPNCHKISGSSQKYNGQIILGNNVNITFGGFLNLNTPIIFKGNTLPSGNYAFGQCYIYNHPLENITTISDSNFSMMFYECHEFDQPISNFFNGIDCNAVSMFFNCYKFNQPIPNLKNCNCMGMFGNCYNFNPSEFIIEDNIGDYRIDAICANCYNFNPSIIKIGNGCTTMNNAFNNCSNLNGATIYLPSTITGPCNNAFRNTHPAKVYFNPMPTANLINFFGSSWGLVFNNCTFYTNNELKIKSLFNSNLTWSPMENGIYNAAANLYIYNNY